MDSRLLMDVRRYAIPVVLALLLHALAVAALYGGWNPEQQAKVIKPQIVKSQLLVLEPKAKPRPKPKPAPKAQAAPIAQSKPEPKSPERPVEPAPDPQADQEAARQQAEQERRERLEALAQSSFLDALESEAGDLAESQAASAAEEVAQSYRYGIYRRVVANWSRPPSARNGMQAKLLVELVPIGDVVTVTLLEGSGNGAFDRSAEAAVRKARRFDVPKESEIFERYFRRFTLLFRPEDLLR